MQVLAVSRPKKERTHALTAKERQSVRARPSLGLSTLRPRYSQVSAEGESSASEPSRADFLFFSTHAGRAEDFCSFATQKKKKKNTRKKQTTIITKRACSCSFYVFICVRFKKKRRRSAWRERAKERERERERARGGRNNPKRNTYPVGSHS